MECEKCQAYSGGATLCLKCEYEALDGYQRTYTTRHEGLGFKRLRENVWTFLDISGEHSYLIGELYASRPELLRDLERFAAEWKEGKIK